MADRCRCRRVVLAWVLLAIAACLAPACTPPSPEGRVDDDSSSALDRPGSGPAGAGATTTVAPATTVAGRRAVNAGNVCRGRADSFLPDTIAGYSVAASGDVTGALPPGTAGVQSAGAALVRQEGGNLQGLVTAIVLEERPGLSAIASATIDLLMQAAGGKADVTDTSVNGYEARTTTGPNGTSLIAWPECLNVWVVVQAPNAAMASDLAAKVHSA